MYDIGFAYEYLRILYTRWNIEYSYDYAYSNREEIKITRNRELSDTLCILVNPTNIYLERIRIKYNGENGINATGLSKEYFNNLSIQLNSSLKTIYKPCEDLILKYYYFQK